MLGWKEKEKTVFPHIPFHPIALDQAMGDLHTPAASALGGRTLTILVAFCLQTLLLTIGRELSWRPQLANSLFPIC